MRDVYRGYSSQYGAGLGNMLAGLFRAAVPIFAPHVKSIGKQLLQTGVAHLNNKLSNTLSPTRPSTRKRKVKRAGATHKTPVAKKRTKGRDIFP